LVYLCLFISAKKRYKYNYNMEFKELNLHPDLQRGIEEAEYITCMPVQEQVLVNAFGGQDLYVQSQTGTGKTAAYLIVIFQRLLTEDLIRGKKAIIMVPTRELAVQVEEEAKLIGKYLPFQIGSFYGGVGYTQQEKMLRDNVQILVGTPGRVLDLNASGKMNLMDISFLVLDEADRMFDMGFYPDLRKLIKVIPPADRRQTMLFSATLNAWVKNLAWEYTKSPYEIEIEPETVTVDEVDQVLYHVPSEDKMRLLLGILEREKPESAVIFCNTKRYTEIIAKRLRINGYECEFIIGDLPQAKRLSVIDDVKAGRVNFLVATDVAARGLDIEGLALVVNYDLPVEAENYVHRIGRTARAGKTGRAITLASEQDVYELPDIERYIGKKIPSEPVSEELYAADDKSGGMRIHADFYEVRREGGRDRDGHRDRGYSDGQGSGRNRGRDSSRRDSRGRDDGRGRGAPHSDRGRGENPYFHSERVSSESGYSSGGEGWSGAGGRPGDSRGGYRERQAPRRNGQNEGNAAAGEQDVSQLPFDKRMAYYKQKYEAEGQGAANTSDAGQQTADGRQTGQRSGGEGGGQGRKPGGRHGSHQGDRQSRGGDRQNQGGGRGDRQSRSGQDHGNSGRDDRQRRGGRRPDQGASSAMRAGQQGARGQSPAASQTPPASKQPQQQKPGKKGILSRILDIFKKE
jgi:ATP-dependent RNA helicase RhlB